MMNTGNGTWLRQKLAQNGFTLQDLCAQSGLSMEVLNRLAADEDATEGEWDLVMGILNDYPILYAPADEILGDFEELMRQGKGEELMDVYYGVNQSSLLFCCARLESDGRMIGANVQTRWMRMIPMMVSDARQLFLAQSMALSNASLQQK